MKTINYIVVEIKEIYETSDNNIIINDSIESVEHIKRVATVISAPDFTILKEGDEVLVHHNIFRKKYSMKGVQLNSNFWIEDDKYFVPLTEIFMFKRDNEWKSLSPFCFIEPIHTEQSNVGFNISDKLHKNNIKSIGTVIFSNDDLEKSNIKKGTKVIFSKNSEYEFKINNKVCYKMTTKDILGVI